MSHIIRISIAYGSEKGPRKKKLVNSLQTFSELIIISKHDEVISKNKH